MLVGGYILDGGELWWVVVGLFRVVVSDHG